MVIKRFRSYIVAAALALVPFTFFQINVSAQTAPASDVVMILPFENTSNRPEYNWVGESFADALAELLNVPGLIVVSSDERELAYQRVRLPLTTLPSRATAVKLAREAKATMIVLGKYSVTPAQGETVASLQGTARVIKVNEGRLMGETMPDGRWATREYDFGGALTRLQDMQGRLAYQILYQRDKALPFSQNQFVQQATKIPPRAFESYVKGVQTVDKETRANYLKNALHFYAEANAGATYPQAAFELGHLYLTQSDWKNAAEYFSKLQKKDPHYAEAAFYASLAYWRQGDLGRALAAVVPLTTELPLTGVYNNAGALSVQAARTEKKAEDRTRLLTQGMNYLARATESSPDDPMVRFNYAYALFLAGKYEESAEQLRSVITADPKDGQAYFLFAKSLERLGRAEAATAADDQARRYLPAYAKWQTEWQKSQTIPGISPRLRDAFNRSDYFDVIRDKYADANTDATGAGSTQDLLVKARELYQAGRDDEALPELRRVLTVEPMSAEAYLLIGRINQRRGDQEAAISALKTAIFWDPKMIDAHILLGRIYLERGDRAMALTYARSAIQIDANNQEAIALQRLVETGGK
ncbi:MAG TPA: tetratricopeptide repeat protein [Pyrinomonadaceae bacterium]|nr:tetratricopeptide repeat protein [Pyrinomonadaceae bacterium]